MWITIKSNKEENQQILKANKEENCRLIIKNQQENTRLMNANRELEEYKRKQDNYFRFRNEVSTRLANIDLSKYVGVVFDEHTVSSEAIRRLEAFHQQLIQDYNSFVVLYDGECKAFLEEYKNAVDVLTGKVHDFIILFKNRETYKNDSLKDHYPYDGKGNLYYDASWQKVSKPAHYTIHLHFQTNSLTITVKDSKTTLYTLTVSHYQPKKVKA